MDLRLLLQIMAEKNASDLHLRSNKPAVFRVDGNLSFRTPEKISGDVVEHWVKSILNEKQMRTFEERLECDMALSVEGLGRFRVNIYRQKNVVNLAFRVIPNRIPTFDTLKLPPVIRKIADEPRGLVLVTGTTGSGKSTTLAAMIDYINSSRSRHIITIEDPIEYLHEDKQSILSQRELAQDTLSYPEALKHSVRQDPDVILLGEMRDLETMGAALTAAQTGHLVLSTIHTIDAVQTVNRIIDVFPPHQQNQIRFQLADTLRGVISQRLLPHMSGSGRVPAVEVMVVTPIIRKYILENTLGEISNVMKQGTYYGMKTFHQALVELIQKGEIALETALEASSNPEEIMMAIRGVQTGTENSGTFFQAALTPRVISFTTKARHGDARAPGALSRILRSKGLSPNTARPEQVHGSTVRIVPPLIHSKTYLRTDGFLTEAANQPLAIFTADCVPVFISADGGRVVGLLHAGWKGVRGKILAQAVRRLRSKWKIKPSRIQVWTGPHIRPCCFVVQWDVARYFPVTRLRQGTQWSVDMGWELRRQAKDLGLRWLVGGGMNKKALSGCTMHGPDYFSFRRNQTAKRQVSVIVKREK